MKKISLLFLLISFSLSCFSQKIKYEVENGWHQTASGSSGTELNDKQSSSTVIKTVTLSQSYGAKKVDAYVQGEYMWNLISFPDYNQKIKLIKDRSPFCAHVILEKYEKIYPGHGYSVGNIQIVKVLHQGKCTTGDYLGKDGKNKELTPSEAK